MRSTDDIIRQLEAEAAQLERELAAVERELELARYNAAEEDDRERDLYEDIEGIDQYGYERW